MSEAVNIVPDTLGTCYGWAFDECGEPAAMVMIEVWHNREWHASGLCWKHVRSVFEGLRSEYRPPNVRIWQEMADFRERGLYV